MIPFNRACFDGKELTYLAEAVLNGHVSGNGPFSTRSEAALRAIHGDGQTLVTTSCTHALEMAALLLNLQSGDEVIVPSFTFVSTAAAFMMHGATPVFVDVDEATLNLSPELVAQAVGPRTRAICAVHYGGVGAWPDRLREIADKHDLLLVEDNAHGLGASWDGQVLGTFGDLSTLSFHETKNITCGEGGALHINDFRFLERAEILREKGTDRSRFLRGQVDKYTWVDIGSSYLPSDLLAAFLYAQLEHLEEITQRRKDIYLQYERLLKPLEENGLLRMPRVPETCSTNYHMFYILLEDEKTRAALIAHLRERNIHAVFHYVPLHLSPVGRSMGYSEGQLPITENLSERLLRLPFYFELTADQVSRIVEEIHAFYGVG